MKRYPTIFSVIALFAAISLSASASHGVVIFSNFGAGDSYDTSGGLLISSEDSSLGGKSTVGFAFTTPGGGPFSYDTVSLAVGLMEGENLFDLSLAEDSGNFPGVEIETLQFINQMVSEPSGSIISANSLHHPVLSPTTQYWLLASTTGENTVVKWFFNDIGDSGPSATQFGINPLTVTTSTRGAFRIIPEPSSLLLLAIGVAGLAGLRRKIE